MTQTKITSKTVFDVKNFICARLDYETGFIKMYFHGIKEPIFITPEDESYEHNRKWIEGVDKAPKESGQS